MKVVKWMEENQNNREDTPQHAGFIQMKKFRFVMLIFLIVFLTAGVTILALSFGDEKAVNVGMQERAEFNKLYNTYDKLKKSYFQDVDEEKLVDGAIDGMVKSLDDPYSDYMTKEESKVFEESITSSFEGIGAEIQEKNGAIVVVSPIKGSPAEKAGIEPNDKITEVDGKSVRGMSANEAVLLIRGEKGTKVTLTIERKEGEEPKKVTITRDEIPINTVYPEMLDNGVAKIQITSFSSHTDKDLSEALKEMEDKGMKSLILDLRKNPGGLLDQAISISNLFVPKGKMLFQVANKDGKVEEYVAKDGKKITVPTVVLVDEGSASASEILAAAVSESAGIPLVGEKTFGKGTVQTTYEFQDGSNIKYTMAKWLTPDGNWINEKGIEPDKKVAMPKYASLSYIDPDHKLKVDSASSDVKAAEQILKELGYNPGKVDSFYDEDTKNAVMEFQKDEKLETTGVLTGDTTIALMNKIREHLQENDPQVKEAAKMLSKKNK
ncbi:S41 family peptidase [Siminovitchia fortis]|nr:S41 family peptidase [Siminovitchia fortis]WHY83043.1 S41 family peptidase [Siminovitchia fortis]